ncbi:MAG: FAD binding domain-containing protein [Ardenticatenaceae bacterium]|nr:FAD binding domain-containing protein [Ardenticatenaceae bacterium]
MNNLIYHRPESVEAALAMLTQPEKRCALLAGGTHLNATLKQAEIDTLVDLQAVGLDQIEVKEGKVTIGAMVTLQRLVDSRAMPPLVRQMAHLEAPNTFRHMATIGGSVGAGEAESELVAALLVCEAKITLQTAQAVQNVSLTDLLNNGVQLPYIITAITIANDGTTAHARVARTPKDKPIVAALGRKTASGTVHLALCGVARRPILVQAADIEQLTPPADFRGSSRYRKAMAGVLTQRVLTEINRQQEEG